MKAIELLLGRIAFNEDLQRIFKEDSSNEEINEYLSEILPSLYTFYIHSGCFEQFKKGFVKGIQDELEGMRRYLNDISKLADALEYPEKPFEYSPEASTIADRKYPAQKFDNALELAVYLGYMTKRECAVAQGRERIGLNLLDSQKQKLFTKNKKVKNFKKTFAKATKNLIQDYRALYSELSLYSTLYETLVQLVLERIPSYKAFDASIHCEYVSEVDKVSVIAPYLENFTKLNQKFKSMLSIYGFIREHKLDPDGDHSKTNQMIFDSMNKAASIFQRHIRDERDNTNPSWFINLWRVEQKLHALDFQVDKQTKALNNLQHAYQQDSCHVEEAKKAKQGVTGSVSKTKATISTPEKAQTKAQNTAKATTTKNVAKTATLQSLAETTTSQDATEVATATATSQSAAETATSQGIAITAETKTITCLSTSAKDDETEFARRYNSQQSLGSAVGTEVTADETCEAETFDYSTLWLSQHKKHNRHPGVTQPADLDSTAIAQSMKNHQSKFCQLFSNVLKKQFTIAELDKLIKAAGGHVDYSRAGSRKKITLHSQASDMLARQPVEIRETLHQAHAKSVKSEKHASITTVKLYRSIFQRAKITPRNLWPQDYTQSAAAVASKRAAL